MRIHMIKLLILTFYFLLVLTGCSIHTQPTPNISEVQAIINTPIPRPYATPRIIQPSFQIDSCWYSDDFGDNGQAFLIVGKSTESDSPILHFFSSQDYLRLEESIISWQSSTQVTHFSHHITTEIPTTLYIDRTDTSGLDIPYDLTITFSDETANVAYSDNSSTLPLPTLFRQVPIKDTFEKWMHLPLFCDEIILPEIESTDTAYLEQLFGPVLHMEENGEYINYDFSSTNLMLHIDSSTGHITTISLKTHDPNIVPYIRGIKIGDSADKLLLYFKNNDLTYNDLQSKAKESGLLDGSISIYGGGLNNFSAFYFSDGEPDYILYCNNNCVRFYLDEKQTIQSIHYYERW